MPLVCVTVVAEAVLEQRLLRDVQAAGARGWTVTEARGQGTRSVRASEGEGANVRLETLVQPDVAQRLLALLARDYFPHFAVVAWTSEVQVVRGEKYA
jgi:nitrogen regulatory protein P-II 2